MGGEAPFGGCIIFVDLQQFCLTNDAPLNENPFLIRKKGFCVLPGYSSVDGFYPDVCSFRIQLHMYIVSSCLLLHW